MAKTKRPRSASTRQRRPSGKPSGRTGGFWVAAGACGLAATLLAGVAVGRWATEDAVPAAEVAAVQPAPAPAVAPAPIPKPDPDLRTTLSAVPAPVPEPPAATVEEEAPRKPAWVRYAVPAPPSANQPMIAIVIDDLGVNLSGTRGITALPGPLTLSFMTYAENLEQQTDAARAQGHELFLHFPMEPMSESADPGPNALLTSLSDQEIEDRLAWGLDRFDGYVGVNNHMGSRFTSDAEGMELVLRELDRRGLIFLDSMTAASSVGAEVAAEFDIPFVSRDVFLDNERDAAAIARTLQALEEKARADGTAIGIGHPYEETIEALRQWLPTLEEKGITLAPVSAIAAASTETVSGDEMVRLDSGSRPE
ncbi:divergent polysaccharide deacetylase family protein [Inquilinus sp. CAU 1745]|uniref:divergent polysaccharide deacetylase family protein n=1 Tax=Inquilinus sp. CAU 1745 TaxID=3140369 RepID=UPI00325BF623